MHGKIINHSAHSSTHTWSHSFTTQSPGCLFYFFSCIFVYFISNVSAEYNSVTIVIKVQTLFFLKKKGEREEILGRRFLYFC